MTQDTLGEGEFGKVVLASLNNLRGKPGILYFVFVFFCICICFHVCISFLYFVVGVSQQLQRQMIS